MLTDAKIKVAKARPDGKAYKLADAEQLYLFVSAAGGRHWRMNYRWRGKQKTLAFGSYPAVTLSEARRKRDEAKALLRDDKDPALERRLARTAGHAAEDNTFERVARAWHSVNSPRWSSHHADDVMRSLERDVFPEIGDLPIRSIRATTVREVLRAIEERPAIETARRIRQRISLVFEYAIALELAESDPAAMVRSTMAPLPVKGRQAAITDLAGVRAVLADVEATPSHIVTKLASRLLALTAVRPGELRAAAWSEFEGIDWEGVLTGPQRPLWRIPAARMKGKLSRKLEQGGDHLVPLARESVELLLVLRTVTGRCELLFPSHWSGRRPMSENAIGYLLNRAGYQGRHVPHGWRAAFSTIMNERARAHGHAGDRAVLDLMLAHVPKDKIESAYNRAAFMSRRRELAQEWATLLVSGLASPEALLGQPVRTQAPVLSIRVAGADAQISVRRAG